jgi:hypothetical protein
MPDVTSPFAFPYPEDTDLVRDGATDIENLAEGVNDYLTGGYLYAGTRYYTSSGTFAKADPLGTGDIGLRAIRVRMVGGGGGSAGVADSPTTGRGSLGNAGGGGAYTESFITDIAGLDSTVVVTRGAGGSAGASGANQGGNGGNSSFGTLVTGPGGSGGSTSVSEQLPRTLIGSAGGTTGTGDLSVAGNAGTYSLLIDGAAANGAQSGDGGSSLLGAGGRGNPSGASFGPAVAGQLHGGGAAGPCALNAQGAQAGAAGANGIVIVDVFV